MNTCLTLLKTDRSKCLVVATTAPKMFRSIFRLNFVRQFLAFCVMTQALPTLTSQQECT